jgi:uncharacterized damage-inducible protein DinB
MRLSLAAVVVLISLAASAADQGGTNPAAGEYAKHWAAMAQLSVAVAQAMPPDEYGFRPDPPSMNFGELMSHITQTNYGYCAGLIDSEPPALPKGADDKESVVKFLSDSLDYCGGVISKLSSEQLDTPHNSPDGRLSGHEILLALHVHIAHHRGQAEIYLRDKGIKPPSFRF